MYSFANDGALISMRVLHEQIHADHDAAATGGIAEHIFMLVDDGGDVLTVLRADARDPAADPVRLLSYVHPPASGPAFLARHGWRVDHLWEHHQDDDIVHLLVDDPVQVLADVAAWRQHHSPGRFGDD